MKKFKTFFLHSALLCNLLEVMHMKIKYLFSVLLLCLNVIGFISCRDSSKYVFHYVCLDEFNGDTLYLWRTTADRLKTDKDYGRNAVDSQIIRSGRVTFTGSIDTLHLYYIEGKNCNTYFYPEHGEITHKYMGTTEYSNPQSLAKQYECLKENGFPKGESRKFMLSNLQNAMGVYLLDYIGYYPNELYTIYDMCNTAMRDTVSLLINMKHQLSKTKELNKEDLYIDFKKSGLGQDNIYFSKYFNKDKIVCLFFANGDSVSFWRKMKELKRTYNNVYFVGYSNKYTTDTDFINHLKKDYGAYLFDDRGRYEESVMYAYRLDYRTAINYYLIFNSDGNLIDKYIE